MVESIPGPVFTAGMLLVAVLGSLVLSAPLAGIAIWRYSRTRRAKHRRALLVSATNAAGQGVGAAALGFVFVAGIGDESAGNAVPLMVGGGLIGGAALAFLPSYLLIVVGCVLVDRLAPRAGEATRRPPAAP